MGIPPLNHFKVLERMLLEFDPIKFPKEIIIKESETITCTCITL